MKTIYDSQSREDLDRVLAQSTESIWANWYDLNVYLIFCQDSEFNVLIYYLDTNDFRRYGYDTFEAMLRDVMNIEIVMTDTLLRNHKLLGDRTIMRCSVCDGGGGFSLHSKNTYRGALESTREDEAESNKIFFEKIYEYLLEYQKKVFRNITEVI